jgi:hypothetical protein
MPPNCAPIHNNTYYLCTGDGLYCFYHDKAVTRAYDAAQTDCEGRGGVLAWYKSYAEQVAVEVGRRWHCRLAPWHCRLALRARDCQCRGTPTDVCRSITAELRTRGPQLLIIGSATSGGDQTLKSN